MKIRVLLKHGHTITFECDDFTASYSVEQGMYTKWDAKGIKPNRPFSFLPNEMVGWERLR